MSVFEKGNVLAKLMIIAEAPGKAEEEIGVPLVGPSGKIFHDILEYIGITREDVIFTNVITSIQEGSSVSQKKRIKLVKEGIPRLKSVIKLLKPKVIVCVGETAMLSMKIIGKKLPITKTITKMNGDVDEIKVKYMDTPLKVIYTIHPAALLPGRHPEYKPMLIRAFTDNRDIIEPVIGRMLRSIEK